MAIKKQDLVNRVSPINHIVEELEKRIDATLKKGFALGKKIIFPYQAADRVLGERVRQEVTERYKSAGWKVKYCPDSRDGDYLTFA